MVTLACEGLGVTLGERAVLADVSARFAPGTLTGVIGPNGAGKSTLARALLGLVPHEGGVTIDGVPAETLAADRRARTLAYLPQGQTLHWPLTVERLVQLGRLPHLGPLSRVGQADRAAIDRAIDRADLTHLRTRIATDLSRALLARALAVEAPALIADEPLAALDPGHQIEVMELLAAEARAGATIIVILHDLTMAARYCDRLLLLDRGRVVAEGPPAAILDASRLAAVYGITARIDHSGDRPLIVPLARV